MFDFDAGKLLIIGIVALVFIPSKDLPRVLRQIGQFVGKMRRMASEFQGQFMDAMREADMADLRREADKLAKAAEIESSFPEVRKKSEPLLSPSPDVPAATSQGHSVAPASLAPPELDQEPEPLPHQPAKTFESVEESALPVLPPPVHDGA
ncbi:MAG: twin-arginine translocase subunit TatB [Beijerinckiaceae bacterium]|nr:twin-arginine translocase subunit TatB [Beijerinckiaceae bacterium]